MEFTITHDGKEITLDTESLSLPEGVAIITPDNVPDGYYTKEAFQARMQERVNRAKKDYEKALLDDSEFHKKIMNKYGVVLDDEGNPQGLEPTVDIEEVKKNTAKQLKGEYEEKLSAKEQELERIRKGKIQGDILRGANGMFKEQYVKSFTGNDDPFVVKQFGDMFGVDDEGKTVLKSDDGGFAIDGNGNHITPEKYFEKNAEQFSDLLVDNRQKSSKFNKSKDQKPIGEKSAEEVKSMSDEEYAKYRKEQGFKDDYFNQ